MIFATVAMIIFLNCKENALFKMIITQKPMTELPYRPDLCGCHSGLNLVHFWTSASYPRGETHTGVAFPP